MINIDLDSDRRNPVLTKSITLGELTDSIIAKDYSPNPFMPLRQPFMPYRPDAEMWKMNRRLSGKDGISAPQPQQQAQLPPPISHNQNKSASNSKVVNDTLILLKEYFIFIEKIKSKLLIHYFN